MAYSTINKHTDYFNTKLYTGTGSSNAVTGVGFQPDFTWIKNRATAGEGHHLYDAVRGVTKRLRSDTDAAESTASNGLTAFGTDGFTVVSNNGVNQNGVAIASWNWKANGQGSSNTDGSINTTYTSVNTTAGFSICKWTGTGANGTIGHGLGAVPTVIIVKNLGANDNWVTYHKPLGATKYLKLNDDSSQGTSSDVWNNTSPTSSVFYVGSNTATNQSGNQMIAYCFTDKIGYSKFDTFEGNGETSGQFVYTGFKPSFLMIKNIDNSGNWWMMDNKRNGYNVTGQRLLANGNGAETTLTDVVDLVSNGFKLRGNYGDINDYSLIYMAFGQSLVGSNNVPCTAR